MEFIQQLLQALSLAGVLETVQNGAPLPSVRLNYSYHGNRHIVRAQLALAHIRLGKLPSSV